MITVSDLPGLLVLALPVLPVLAAMTAAAMPREDRLALRAVGVGALVVTVVVAIVAVVLGRTALEAGGIVTPALHAAPLLRLTSGAVLPVLTVLAVAPLALRAGAPRVREGMAPYVITCLVQTAIVVGTLLLDDVVDAFAAAIVAAVPGFALVALFGGPERGTVTWRAAALWLVVDGLALALLLTPTPPAFIPGWFVTFALLGPGLVRLAAGPHGLWALPYSEMAPVAGAVTAAAVSFPLGAVLLWRAAEIVGGPGLLVLSPPLVAVLSGSVLVGAVLVTMERDLRRIAAHWIGLLGSIVALGVLAAVVDGRAPDAAIGLACVGGLAIALLLMVAEAIERRLETRRVVQLAGLWHDAPFLAILLPLSLLAVGGVPGPGSATVLWPTLIGLLRSHEVFAWGGLAAIAGVLLGQVGAAVVVARVVQPQRRRHSTLIRVSFSQAVRLSIPLLVLVVASLLAGLGLGGAP